MLLACASLLKPPILGAIIICSDKTYSSKTQASATPITSSGQKRKVIMTKDQWHMREGRKEKKVKKKKRNTSSGFGKH